MVQCLPAQHAGSPGLNGALFKIKIKKKRPGLCFCMLVLEVDTTRRCACEASFVAAQRCCSEPGLTQFRLSGSGQPLDGFLCISLLTSVAPDLTPSTHKAGRKQELAADQWPLPVVKQENCPISSLSLPHLHTPDLP